MQRFNCLPSNSGNVTSMYIYGAKKDDIGSLARFFIIYDNFYFADVEEDPGYEEF